MPMAFFTCLLLAFLCPLPSWAGPISIASLSPYLSTVVPACAHGCLRSFIADSFPSSTCKSQSDIGCLCTRDSKTGITLGEGALRCLAAECGKNTTAIREAYRVYGICQQVPKAKPMTHPTLTATQVVVTTVPSSSSPTSTMSDEDTDTALPPPFRSHRHPSISATTRDVPVPSTIVADTSIPVPFTSTTSNIPSTTEATEPSTSQSATSSSSSPTVTAVAASAPSPVLTKPEIAGVTVGSIAAAGFVFGILALFFCLRGRRQKKKRASDASFGNDKIIIDQPRTPSPPSSLAARDIEHGIRGPETSQPYGLHAQAAIGRPPSNRWSFWRSSMKPEDIGIAVAPDPVQQTPYDRSPVTPVSAASYETTSLLLPEKPTYSLYPPPLRLSSHNSHVSPIDAPGTQAVDFARMPPGPIIRPAPAPRGRGTMDTSQTYFHHGQSTLRHVPPDPFVEPASNGRTVLAKQHQTLPAQRPRAAAPAPAVVQHGRLAEPVQVPRKPVPARLPTNDPRVTAQVDNPNDISALYSHPASLTAGPSMSLGAAHPVRRKSSGKRRADGKRPVTFLSTTSDTSFEDAESDDEPPPPLPMSVLAPAVALPRSRPHAAGVRYPVKPTSAAASPSFNQATREVRREQIELNPASDRSKGKAKVNPRTPSPRDKPVPNVPELAGSPLGERQQAPDSSSDRVKPGSAKWSILVAPGLEGIENIGTPRSNASTEWTPVSTPTRRAR